MTTKFVNIREFRENMAKISREARKKNQRVVVMKHAMPLFELTPLVGDDEGAYREEFVRGLMESIRQADRGASRPLRAVKKDLGLR